MNEFMESLLDYQADEMEKGNRPYPDKKENPVRYVSYKLRAVKKRGEPYVDLTSSQEAAVAAASYLDSTLNANPFKLKKSKKAVKLLAKYYLLNNPTW